MCWWVLPACAAPSGNLLLVLPLGGNNFFPQSMQWPGLMGFLGTFAGIPGWLLHPGPVGNFRRRGIHNVGCICIKNYSFFLQVLWDHYCCLLWMLYCASSWLRFPLSPCTCNVTALSMSFKNIKFEQFGRSEMGVGRKGRSYFQKSG